MRSLPLPGGGRVALLAVLLATLPSRAEPADVEASALLSPDDAVTAALTIHPEVREAEAELLLARGLRARSILFERNPQLSGATTPDGERANATLTQPLSLTGEGWHARRAAAWRIEAAEALRRRARLAAAAEARQAYVDAVVAGGRVRVAVDGVDLAGRLRAAVARQHEEGEAALLDLRLARLAEVQAAGALLDARRAEAQSLRALAARLGQVVSAEQLPTDPRIAAPEPDVPAPRERSDIAALRAALRSAEADLRRQRAAAIPPVGVGVNAEIEDGQTFIGPALSLTLPLFDRNQAGRAGARGVLAVTEARVASLEARAATEAATAAQRVDEAAELSAMLLVDPVQDAIAALESIEAGYLAGQIDLPSAVLLQGEVLEGRAAAISLLGGVAAARLDLLLATDDEALLGGAP
jgi:outer membrane protein TolC